MSSLPKSTDRLRQEAKALSKKEDILHTAALEKIARFYGFSNWKAVLNTSGESCISDPTNSKEATESLDDVVAKNKKFFVSLGIEFAMFEPTATGLQKSILDATQPVRRLFESQSFHFFDQQGQGENYKVIKIAHLSTNNEIIRTQVSLYRPQTKQGDPRMWFKSLPNYANPNEQIAIVVCCDELCLFNFSRFSFENIPSVSPVSELISHIASRFNSTAEELLQKLKEIRFVASE